MGAGANLGDRWATLRAAGTALAQTPGILAVAVSPVYETAPVGVTDQPMFLNLVFGLETTLAPEVLLVRLRAQEISAGRRREQEIRWGPRVLDLDLLFYEGEMRPGPELILPHPRLWERAFVTVPLRDLLVYSPRFQRACWDEARARLAALPANAPGVTRWEPPV